jgi:hypothetical protein
MKRHQLICVCSFQQNITSEKLTKTYNNPYTLRCRKIASMLFLVAIFRRFLGTIQVARLAMCNIRKFSESFMVFDGVNSFPIEQF